MFMAERVAMRDPTGRFNPFATQHISSCGKFDGKGTRKTQGKAAWIPLPFEITSRSDHLSKGRPSGERNQHQLVALISGGKKSGMKALSRGKPHRVRRHQRGWLWRRRKHWNRGKWRNKRRKTTYGVLLFLVAVSLWRESGSGTGEIHTRKPKKLGISPPKLERRGTRVIPTLEGGLPHSSGSPFLGAIIRSLNHPR